MPEQTLETCRRWYNTGLEDRKTAWEERRESVGKYDQLRQVKDFRDTHPFAANIHHPMLQVVAQDLDHAFYAFFRRVQAGARSGYPRFEGRSSRPAGPRRLASKNTATAERQGGSRVVAG